MATTRSVLFLLILIILDAHPSEVDTAQIRGAKKAKNTKVLHGTDSFEGSSSALISDLRSAQSRVLRQPRLGGRQVGALGGAGFGSPWGARRDALGRAGVGVLGGALGGALGVGRARVGAQRGARVGVRGRTHGEAIAGGPLEPLWGALDGAGAQAGWGSARLGGLGGALGGAGWGPVRGPLRRVQAGPRWGPLGGAGGRALRGALGGGRMRGGALQGALRGAQRGALRGAVQGALVYGALGGRPLVGALRGANRGAVQGAILGSLNGGRFRG